MERAFKFLALFRQAAAGRSLRFIKFALAIGLLAVLFCWHGNGARALQLLLDTRIEYAAALFLISLLINGLSAFKWQLLLRAQGAILAFPRLMGLYLVGKFFGNFMPSMVGGDLARIALLAPQIGSRGLAAASVFLERLTGMAALIALAGICAMVTPAMGNGRAAWVALCAAAVAGLFLFVRLPRLGPGSMQMQLSNIAKRFPLSRRAVSPLKTLSAHLAFFRQDRASLVTAVLLSVVFYAGVSASLYIGCLSVGFHPSYLAVALATPLIYLATSLPVSVGNIGWWEWCVGLGLQPTGIPLQGGFAVAVLLRAAAFCLSLIGGALFLGSCRAATEDC